MPQNDGKIRAVCLREQPEMEREIFPACFEPFVCVQTPMRLSVRHISCKYSLGSPCYNGIIRDLACTHENSLLIVSIENYIIERSKAHIRAEQGTNPRDNWGSWQV